MNSDWVEAKAEGSEEGGVPEQRPGGSAAASRANAATQPPVLLVSGVNAAQNCARPVGQELGCEVDVAESRKSAMSMLRRKEYAAVLVDEAIAEADVDGAEQLWRAAGLAVTVQLNFAICSIARVTRELRAALSRRALEEVRARQSAGQSLQADIGSALTGMVLQLDLLRASPDIPEQFRERLSEVSGLTVELRRKLAPPLPQRTVVDAAVKTVKLGLRASAARS